MMVVLVCSEVLCEFLNSLCENCNLNLRRTCVTFMTTVLFNNLGFCFLRNQASHLHVFFEIPLPKKDAGDTFFLEKGFLASAFVLKDTAILAQLWHLVNKYRSTFPWP